MRSHAERPATRSPRSTEHAQSCAARHPASQSPAASCSSAALGHRFERIAIDPVRTGERHAGEGIAPLRPAAWPVPIQRKQVWNGVWLGEGDDRRRERELEEERQREQERQRQLEQQRLVQERQRQLELQQLEQERQRQLVLQRQEQERQEQERQRQLREEQQRREEQERQRQLQEEQERRERQEQERLRVQQQQKEEEERLQFERPPQKEQVDRRSSVEPSQSRVQIRSNYGSISQRPSGLVTVNRRSHSDSEDDEEGLRLPLVQGNRGTGGSKLEKLANFVSINSPGTQTGVVGGVGGVNTALSIPTTVPKLQNSSYTSKMTSPTTGIGAGLNILGGMSDLVATGQGLHNMSQEGGFAGFFRGMRDTFSRRRNETGAQAETRSTAKRLAVDTTVNLTDAANQGMQGANAISSLMHGGTSVLPHALGGVTAGLGAGVQGVVAGRAAWRMGRAWHHKRKVDAIRHGIGFGQMSPENQAAANHMSQQLGKRRTRNIIGGLGATAGAVGGGLLLGSLLGGAALLGPIGWGLIGASALVAAGLGIHKLYKHYQKKNAGTLGIDRQRHADNLHDAVVGNHQQNKADALRILGSHGITEDQAKDPVKGKQLIRRKLEGW